MTVLGGLQSERLADAFKDAERFNTDDGIRRAAIIRLEERRGPPLGFQYR